MIEHDIKNRFTGATQFTAYIDCEEVYSDGWKKRLAVLLAIKNGANLSRTDLRGANLSGIDLSGANLSGANLSGANLREAKGIVSFGPVGKTGRIGYAVNHGGHAMVKLGCFWGTEKEAINAIKEKYGPKSSYAKLVKAACAVVMEGGE